MEAVAQASFKVETTKNKKEEEEEEEEESINTQRSEAHK